MTTVTCISLTVPTRLYVYGCYPGWGATGDARKFFVADNDLQVGDQIAIIGYKDTYKEARRGSVQVYASRSRRLTLSNSFPHYIHSRCRIGIGSAFT